MVGYIVFLSPDHFVYVA